MTEGRGSLEALSHKKIKIYMLIILALFFLVALSSCIPSHFFERTGRWVCSEPYFVLESRYVDGRLLEHHEYLEIDGRVQQVLVVSQSSLFEVFPDSGTSDGLHSSDLLLSGRWRYRGKQLVVSIKKDCVFNGAYQELVFDFEESTDSEESD